MGNNIKQAKEYTTVHGCSTCGEISKGFITAENGKRVCRICGGTVLTLQEAFDHILEQKSYIRELTGQEFD